MLYWSKSHQIFPFSNLIYTHFNSLTFDNHLLTLDFTITFRLALTCKKWSTQIWSVQSSMRLDSADHIRALCAPPDTDTVKLSARPRPKQLRMSSSSSSSEGQIGINYSAVILAAAQANPTPFIRQSANSLTAVDLSYTTLGNDSLFV
jgi:hypothetical protein